jgi:hypothetical protein
MDLCQSSTNTAASQLAVLFRPNDEPSFRPKLFTNYRSGGAKKPVPLPNLLPDTTMPLPLRLRFAIAVALPLSVLGVILTLSLSKGKDPEGLRPSTALPHFPTPTCDSL